MTRQPRLCQDLSAGNESQDILNEMGNPMLKCSCLTGTLIVTALFGAVNARADLALTPAGIADGFILTTFASGLPNIITEGPFGVTLASNGNVIAFDYASSTRYVFPDIDGQTPATALFAPVVSNSAAEGYANASGKPYGGDGFHFVQFNDDGTVNHILTGVSAGPDLGMWTNPVNQHLISASTVGLIDIDPLAGAGAGSFRVIHAGIFPDGVSVSPDGTTVYAAFFGTHVVIAYDIATGALITTYTGLPSPDGTGVISSSNMLNGDIIINNNNGEIDLLDPITHAFVPIATGGSRGDFTSPDTSNGSLFLDYTDSIARLSCGPQCSIGSPVPGPQPAAVPEPSSIFLLGTAFIVWAIRHKIHA